MADFDIAICGAGPVGMALGLMSVGRGIPAGRVVLIDAKNLEQAVADPRSIALSYGSRQILEELGAWPIAADAIHQIHVSRRGHFGRTLIDRTEFDLPALGYVTRYGALVNALAERAAAEGIKIMRPLRVETIDESEPDVKIACSDQTQVVAQIAVQAEGGLFSEQSDKALHRDYDQIAVVAQVWASGAITHRAFERFTDEGPLALLPQDDGYALVWCVRPQRAADLLEMTDDKFLTALSEAFGSRLGRFIRVSRRGSFVLGLNADVSASARTIAIGNAAQTLHPVAGQGLNLGLRDAVVLAQMLMQESGPTALAHFVSARQSDRNTTIRLTDAMARLFASGRDGALSQTLLGASLGIVDVMQPAKRLLAEQMMFGRR